MPPKTPKTNQTSGELPMSTVNCYGIHADEVGLRYLVQEKTSNAYGFSKQEKFEVATTFGHKNCPHNYKIVADQRGLEHPTALAASPIPMVQKGYLADPEEDLEVLTAFSGAHVIPAWMLNQHTLRARLFVSNLAVLIIPNCTPSQSGIINEVQSGIEHFHGKVIFHGDYYFSKNLERLPKLPEMTTKEARRIGLANMSNYLRLTGNQDS